jgi:hypothetical protein
MNQNNHSVGYLMNYSPSSSTSITVPLINSNNVPMTNQYNSFQAEAQYNNHRFQPDGMTFTLSTTATPMSYAPSTYVYHHHSTTNNTTPSVSTNSSAPPTPTDPVAPFHIENHPMTHYQQQQRSHYHQPSTSFISNLSAYPPQQQQQEQQRDENSYLFYEC